MLPGDAAVITEQKAICELRRMTPDELKEYMDKAWERSSPEAFRTIIGCNVEDIDSVLEKMREEEERKDEL